MRRISVSAQAPNSRAKFRQSWPILSDTSPTTAKKVSLSNYINVVNYAQKRRKYANLLSYFTQIGEGGVRGKTFVIVSPLTSAGHVCATARIDGRKNGRSV
jgi:hypothetical protein